MHWRHWQKLEVGQGNVTLMTLTRMARVLKVDVGALLRDPRGRLN